MQILPFNSSTGRSSSEGSSGSSGTGSEDETGSDEYDSDEQEGTSGLSKIPGINTLYRSASQTTQQQQSQQPLNPRNLTLRLGQVTSTGTTNAPGKAIVQLAHGGGDGEAAAGMRAPVTRGMMRRRMTMTATRMRTI